MKSKKMKIYLISNYEKRGYVKYDSAVVVAPDEETARNMNPSTGKWITDWNDMLGLWCSNASQVVVQYLGDANSNIEIGLICKESTIK